MLAEKAKERQNLGLKSDEGTRTDVALGKTAGVGKDTIHKVETIEKNAMHRTGKCEWHFCKKVIMHKAELSP